MQSDESSLLVRLGGDAGLTRILDLHYLRVIEDDHLREYFIDVDLDRLKAAQLGFLRTAFGGSGGSYDAAALRLAHRDQLVSELAFDTFIDILVACAVDCGAGAADQAAIRDVLKALRDGIITRFQPNPAYNYPTKPV